MAVSTASEGLEPLDPDGVAVAIDPDTKRGEGQLRMISCGDRLVNRCATLGLKARQQHGALDLRAGHVGREVDGRQPSARDRQGEAAVVRFEARAHPRERRDDAAHGTAAQRVVSGDRGRERMRGEDAREQPGRGAGVAGIEHAGGGLKAAQPAADNRHAARERLAAGIRGRS
jgi:hypothetical protein